MAAQEETPVVQDTAADVDDANKKPPPAEETFFDCLEGKTKEEILAMDGFAKPTRHLWIAMAFLRLSPNLFAFLSSSSC